MTTSKNSFSSRATLRVGSDSFEIYRLDALSKTGIGNVERLPFSLKVLLENLLRHEDSHFVQTDDIPALASWDPANSEKEVSFMPARVLLQDFTGVPCVVDLAAMRDALRDMGADPKRANPLIPADLVIDHSVQVDEFGTAERIRLQRAARVPAQSGALRIPALGPESFEEFRVVPPDTGIVHQVNLEYLAPRRLHRSQGWHRARLSRHAGRHRFAYNNDQWTGRRRLGRWRY